ncbi:hypothetical protein CTI14_54880, partial [Methylobacterium radiotolerans]
MGWVDSGNETLTFLADLGFALMMFGGGHPCANAGQDTVSFVQLSLICIVALLGPRSRPGGPGICRSCW